jgi:hypothetical protein
MLTEWAPRKASIMPRRTLPTNTGAMKRPKGMRTAPAVRPAISNTGLGMTESTNKVSMPKRRTNLSVAGWGDLLPSRSHWGVDPRHGLHAVICRQSFPTRPGTPILQKNRRATAQPNTTKTMIAYSGMLRTCSS